MKSDLHARLLDQAAAEEGAADERGEVDRHGTGVGIDFDLSLDPLDRRGSEAERTVGCTHTNHDLLLLRRHPALALPFPPLRSAGLG